MVSWRRGDVTSFQNPDDLDDFDDFDDFDYFDDTDDSDGPADSNGSNGFDKFVDAVWEEHGDSILAAISAAGKEKREVSREGVQRFAYVYGAFQRFFGTENVYFTVQRSFSSVCIYADVSDMSFHGEMLDEFIEVMSHVDTSGIMRRVDDKFSFGVTIMHFFKPRSQN